MVGLKIMEQRENGSLWFEVQELCEFWSHDHLYRKLPYSHCPDKITVYLFSEKSVPSFLSFFAGRG